MLTVPVSDVRQGRYFGFKVDDVRVIRVLTVDVRISGSEQREQIRTEIFTNPVTEESSYSPIAQEVLTGSYGSAFVRV